MLSQCHLTEESLTGVLQPYLKIDCGLGEAPFWERSSHQLRFVDIIKQKLHVIDLNQGPSSLKSVDLDVPVGWVLDSCLAYRIILICSPAHLKGYRTTADIEGIDGEIIVGAKHGYALLDIKTGKHEYIKRLWDESDGPGKEER